jgi:ABC-2 type transport system permease protein
MTQSGTIAAPQASAINQDNKEAISEIFSYFDDIPVVQIVSWFIFFFIGGYLLYGSLFAAIGSVVDTDTDTQQFMLPITIPLMLGLFVMFYTLNNYNSPIAFWFSMIPLTSPIVMMARIPFGVPAWQIWLSAFILIASFIGAIWMAGKIYRTGILLYGKKVSYKEIFKWLTYKN